MMWAFFGKILAMKPVGFLKQALSEPNGNPSSSRFTAFLITFATISWVSFVVVHTGTLPDLTSAAMFIAAGNGGYMANKVSAIFNKGDGNGGT